MDKGGAKKEPELKINNFGSATLVYIVQHKIFIDKNTKYEYIMKLTETQT